VTQRSSRIVREGRRGFIEAARGAAIASFKARAFDQAQASPATESAQAGLSYRQQAIAHIFTGDA